MANTEFYCNASTGSNMNGGSDENASPSYAATNGGWNSGTGVFTPTSGDPSAVSPTLVGQFASVFTDGATTPVFVGRVTAVSSTTLTVSTSARMGSAPTTAGSGISVNVGGVWKGPNGANTFPFGKAWSSATNASSHPPRINFKNNASYSISTGLSQNQPGPTTFQGYSSVAGDGGRATIDGSTNAITLLSVGQSYLAFADFIFASSATTGTGAGLSVIGSRVDVLRCVAHGTRGNGFDINDPASGVVLVECEAYACNGSNTSGGGGYRADGVVCIRCIAHDNTGSNSRGFSSLSNYLSVFVDCIADSNTSHGFYLAADWIRVIGCNSYNNGGDGIRWANSTYGSCYIENCNLVKNGGYGINQSSALLNCGYVFNCGFGGGSDANTSGQTSLGGTIVSGSVTYTSNPWTDPANGDFTLNSTAGDGAAATGAGLGTFTQTASSYTGTVSYPDIGAVQNLDGGGGSVIFIPVVNALIG